LENQEIKALNSIEQTTKHPNQEITTLEVEVEFETKERWKQRAYRTAPITIGKDGNLPL